MGCKHSIVAVQGHRIKSSLRRLVFPFRSIVVGVESPHRLFRPSGQATTAMEDLKAALNEHVDLVSDLFEKFSADLHGGFGPAVDNFIGFFHAIDWKEPWLICLLAFHFILLLTTLLSRKNVNFQLFLSLLAFSGVYLAERINSFLGKRWKSFSSQNYFDPHGLFISVLWSGPLLVITIMIVVNTLFTLCHLMVKWKRAELRHLARVGRDKQE